MQNEPIHVISLGAGTQSSVVLLKACRSEITPRPVAAIFADTQVEPQSVYRWLDWLESVSIIPIIRVSNGNLEDGSTKLYISTKSKKVTGQSIPAFANQGRVIFPRQCTSDYKVNAINKQLTRLMREHKTKRAISWIGLSLDEVHRMKPSRRSNVENRWPLIELRMRRHDSLIWMKNNGYPEPPRSACRGCPYHSDYEWRQLKEHEPLDFTAAVEYEKRLQKAYAELGNERMPKPFLHRSCVPLDQVDLSTDEERGQQSLFGNECQGLCGV